MAASFVAAGTASGIAEGSTGSPAPGAPAGLADGMLLLCFVTSRDNVTHSMPTGWAQALQQSNTATTQVSLWYAWYKASSPDSAKHEVSAGNPSVTHSGSHACEARVAAFKNVIDSSATIVPVVVGSISATGTSVSTAGIDPTFDDALMCHFLGAGTANTANTLTSPGGITTALFTASNTASNTNGRACLGAYYSTTPVNSGSTSPTATVTCLAAPSTANGWAGFQVAIKPSTRAYVRQSGTIETTGSGTSQTVTLGAVRAGSTLLACVGWFASSGSPTVSDNVNGSWGSALRQTTDSSDGYTLALFKFENSAAGTPTVTFGIGSNTNRVLGVVEVANAGSVATTAAQYQATPTTSTDAITSGTLSYSSGNYQIVGFISSPQDDAYCTVGTNFTSVATYGPSSSATRIESKYVTASTSAAATGTGANTPHVSFGAAVLEAISAATTANCSETGGTAATEATSTAQVQTGACAETGGTAATESCTATNADSGSATTAACADTSTAAATEAATSTQAQAAACAETGATAATEASTGTSGAVPTTGAHTLAHNSVGDSGTTTVTTTLTTQASGSTFIASTGLGTDSAMQLPSDNKGNTPYSWIEAAITEYIDWPGSGIRGGIFLSGAGGSGHTFTAHRSSGDECSLAVVEVKNGGVLKDHQVSRPTTSPATSPNVTSDAAATLVCILWGGGQSATNLTPDAASIAAGWSRIEFYGAPDSSSIQCAIAVRDVSGAGTYSCTWTLSPSQNSICEIFAIQAPATSATTASCAETASSAATEASTSAEANGAACPQVATAAAGEAATSTQTIGASCAEQSSGVSAESASATAVSTASCAETASSAATEAATALSPVATAATCAETSTTAATESATASNPIASTADCAEVSSIAATESATAAPSLAAYVNEVASVVASESATGAQSQACNASETSTGAATEAGVSVQAQAGICSQIATAAPSEAATISNIIASSANCAEVASTAATEANTAREANTASCSETSTASATEAGVVSNLIALNVYCAEVSTAAANETASSTQSLSIACAQIANAAAVESSSAIEPQNANITERGDTAATEVAATLATGRADVAETASTAATEAAQGTSQNAAVCIEASSVASTDAPVGQQSLAANCSEHPSATASETSTAASTQQATASEVSQVAASEQAIAQNAVSYNAYCAEVSQVAASEAVTASASITASCAQASVGIATQTSIAAQNQAISCNELSSGQSVDAASLINVWAATEANVYQQAYAIALERSDVLQYAFAQCSEDALAAAVERARCTLGNVVYDVRKFSLLIASKRARLSDAAVSRSRFSDVAPRDVLSEPVKGS